MSSPSRNGRLALVVGGGPVGASLARAARGLSVVLLAHERRVPVARAEGAFDARVYALSPANVAFLGLKAERLTPVHAMRVFGDDERMKLPYAGVVVTDTDPSDDVAVVVIVA